MLLIIGFVVGGTVGAFAFKRVQFLALLLPAGGAAALAAVCWVREARLGRVGG